MRTLAVTAGAALLIGVGGAMILGGGAALRGASMPVEPAIVVPPAEPAKQGPAKPQPVERVPARAVQPEIVAAPPVEAATLERLEPRGALSKLGQALPPKPKTPDEWDGTKLFRPVATAAGMIEAKGYTVALLGVEVVPPEETCTHQGQSWPCGLRARTAFRNLLRGRSITCLVPPEPERTALVGHCQLGQLDLGGWLVANGWARASATGPYAALGEAAQRGGKGLFGKPPETGAPEMSAAASALPAPPPVAESLLPAAPVSATAPGETPPSSTPSDTAPAGATPPVAPPALQQ